MSECSNLNINFTYAGEQTKEYIKSLKLKSYDGDDLYFFAHDMFPIIYSDELNKIYFFEFIPNENREQKEHRQKMLIQKYKRKFIDHYFRHVDENILLVQNKVVRIFADCSSYQDGIAIYVLDIIAPDFTQNDALWLKKIIREAFYFKHKNVPCFDYYDYSKSLTI